MTSSFTKGLAASLALATALVLGACSSSDQSGAQSGTESGAQSGTASAVPAPDVDRSGTGNFPAVTDKDGTPTIAAGTGTEPTQVIAKTLTKGDGDEVSQSDLVLANYVGTLWNGTIIDSSYSRGAPAGFSLGSVIEGWKYGLAGQHVGDRVQLVIPSEWGYGTTGSGSTVPANSTLVFVVDILATADPSDTSALSGATATGDKLPTGIAVSGDLGSKPTLTFSGTTQPTEDSATVIATGKGAEITKDDFVIYQAVAGYYPDAATISASWDTGAQVAQSGVTQFVGKKVGSRLLLVFKPTAAAGQSGATEADTSATVMVVDVLGVLTAPK